MIPILLPVMISWDGVKAKKRKQICYQIRQVKWTHLQKTIGVIFFFLLLFFSLLSKREKPNNHQIKEIVNEQCI